MRSFREAVVEVLRRDGPTEVLRLVQAALELRPAKNPRPWAHVERVCRMVNSGASGLYLVQEPTYALADARAIIPPHAGRLRATVLALSAARGPMALSALARAYTDTYRTATKCPEFWVFSLLRSEEARPLVKERGRMVIGIRGEVRYSKQPAPSRDSILGRIDERSLETLLEGRLDLLEPGLTVVQRQFSIKGVGRIDLLCRDRKRNLVVVEIKRPAADYREVVGQTTSYMGWIQKHLAGPGQAVRGIIVVGRADDRLRYAADVVGSILVRPFY
jgi:Endonuclease NucS C-terminal domain